MMEPVTSSHIYSRSTLVEVLDDLCVKFILNLPEEELQSIERLSFQIEAAQWYFEDFIREVNPSLPTLNLRSFLSKIFAVCPLPLIAGLPPNGAESAFLNFMAYKTRVPVRGAIILNLTMDKCLLVKGWKKGASWSFPRGKINKDEDDLVCAIREVREETGFDCEGFAKVEHFVDMTMRDQNLKLFIVPGIPEDTVFECQTRKEISDIKWHKLSDLPTYNKNKNIPQNEVRTGKYYMVTPFLRGLRKWISTEGKKWLQDQRQQKLSSAASLITAEETEVEEELASPIIDGSAEFLNYVNVQSPVATNGYSGNLEHDEASIRLKNMLHFGPPKEQVDQSSARLMNMLGGGAGRSSEHPNVAQLGPNPRTLLSMLRAGDGSGALNQVPEVNKLAPQISNHVPPNQTFSVPPRQLSEFFHQIPQSVNLQPVQQQQQQQRNAPAPQRNTGGIGAGAGWPQFPRNIPEQTPSPPPTSNFPAPPPQTAPTHPQLGPSNHPTPLPSSQNHTSYSPTPYQQNFSPLNRNGFKPPSYPQPTPQLPLTPLDAFIPPPVPSKPPDLGQAGTLLSILKGATPAPAPVAHVPPPATHVPLPTTHVPPPTTHVPLPTTHVPPPATHVPPPASPTRKPSTPVQSPTQTNPQRPSTPKGPRAQYQQPANKNAFFDTLHRSASNSPRASTAFTPPPLNRASTTHSPFRTSSTSYGPPKTKTPVQGPPFDRRESVSNEQQQTLLAMFRSGTPGQPTTGLNDEAVMSSPEHSPARPVRVRGSGSRSGSRAARRTKGSETPRSPLGKEKERESLMKYLEGVANGAGQ